MSFMTPEQIDQAIANRLIKEYDKSGWILRFYSHPKTDGPNKYSAYLTVPEYPYPTNGYAKTRREACRLATVAMLDRLHKRFNESHAAEMAAV
jgi:hypothetical protein